MGLIRLIFIGLLIWLIYATIKRYKRHSSGDNPSPTSTPPTSPPATSEKMVKCAHCDTHLPANQAIHYHTLWFCCNDHQKAYLNNKPEN